MMLWMWQVPAAVLALLTWLNAPPTYLGDVARHEAVRRQMSAKTTRLYTVIGVPDTTPPETTVAAPPDVDVAAAAKPAKPAEPPHDEKWWHTRMSTAVEARDRDQVLADALQSRINALANDVINLDDPARKQLAASHRQRALEEFDRLKKQLVLDNDAIAAVVEDARRQGIPPGWIR